MTKENTVVLNLDRYNELRDFKKNITENKFCIPHKESYYNNAYYEYLSKEEFKDEIIKEHSEEVDEFNRIIKRQEDEIRILKDRLIDEQGKRRNWWNSKE